MTRREQLTAAALTLGLVLSCVGIACALGGPWALVWAGILLLVAGLRLDAQ